MPAHRLPMHKIKDVLRMHFRLQLSCRQWLRFVDPVMRLERKAGEKLFVDWSGDTIGVIDPETGEMREAQLFMAVLGSLNYLYAEATLVIAPYTTVPRLDQNIMVISSPLTASLKSQNLLTKWSQRALRTNRIPKLSSGEPSGLYFSRSVR